MPPTTALPKRSQAIDEDGDDGAEHEDVKELGRRCEVGTLQEGTLQDLLQRLGMQLDTGDRGFERGRSQVEQARRARADDEDAAFDLVLADLAVQHLVGRQVTLLRARRELDPHLAGGLGRHLVVADLDADDPGLLAEGLLAARAGGFDDIGRCALSEAEQIGSERGVELIADPDDHRHAADDLIVLGDPVERAGALRLVLELCEARRGARVVWREQGRIVAAMGEARLGLGLRRAGRRRDEAEHDRSLADRLGEDLIVGGKLLDLLPEARERVGLRPEAAARWRETCGRARGTPCRSRSPRLRPPRACRRGRPVLCGARAIARSASATPRRYR